MKENVIEGDTSYRMHHPTAICSESKFENIAGDKLSLWTKENESNVGSPRCGLGAETNKKYFTEILQHFLRTCDILR